MGSRVNALNIFITTAIWTFFLAHPFILGLVGSWMFSAYASQIEPPMPKPRSHREALYAWWYTVVHTAAANLDRLQGRQ